MIFVVAMRPKWVHVSALLVLALLAACSSPQTQQVAIADLLSLDGRQAVIRTAGPSLGEVGWRASHRAPWFMPSLSRVKAMSIPVGTTASWEVRLVEPSAGEPAALLPDALVVSHAVWDVRIHNQEGSLDLTSGVPVGATLQRVACFEARCEYRALRAADLFSFELGGSQIPEVPTRWPRPRSAFHIDVLFQLAIEPEYHDTGAPFPAPELELRFGFVPGEGTVQLSSTGSTTH